MIIKLTDTSAREIETRLLGARRNLGNASGMVLTLLVSAERRTFDQTYAAAQVAAREHPSRLIMVVRTTGKTDRFDAEIHLAEDVPGEVIVLYLGGELVNHADSTVLPLLLPDSPVVMWWPQTSPEVPAEDQLGALADRRITDASGDSSPSKALLARACHHAAGDTDLTWTRLTPWRALLAAAMDQYPTRVLSASVHASRNNAPAELMAAWLDSRLKVPVHRKVSDGPGITSVTLETPGGDIVVARQDGKTATYAIPGQPRRTVALKRRDINELLTEELRRMDADAVYQETLSAYARRHGDGDSHQTRPASTTEDAATTVARTGARSSSRKAAAVAESVAEPAPQIVGPTAQQPPTLPDAQDPE